MRVIAKKALKDFRDIHKDAEQILKSRYAEISKNKFSSSTDIIELYPKSSILNDNRVVFRLKGNHYRIVTKINYDYGIIWIRFVGNHTQYDKIDANKI